MPWSLKHHHRTVSPVAVDLPACGTSAFFSQHSRAFRMPVISNDYHKIVVVASGSGAVQLTSQDSKLARGALLLIPPQVPHRFVDDPASPLSLAVLCLNSAMIQMLPAGSWSAVKRAFSMEPAHFIYWICGASLLQVQHLFRQIALECNESHGYAALQTAGLTTQALAVLLRGMRCASPAATSDGIATSILWIDRHFTQTIRIADLAQAAGLSYRAYTLQFRRATGQSVIQFITRRRIQFSIHCLLGSGDILGSATASGFRDLSHFYRVFKQHTGLTPSHYLQKHGSSSATFGSQADS